MRKRTGRGRWRHKKTEKTNKKGKRNSKEMEKKKPVKLLALALVKFRCDVCNGAFHTRNDYMLDCVDTAVSQLDNFI